MKKFISKCLVTLLLLNNVFNITTISIYYAYAEQITEDTTPPTQPTNLSVETTTPGAITVSWTGSTDDSDQISYNIYRDLTFINSTNETYYTDCGLLSGTTYEYIVQAEDGSGNLSIMSEPLAVTTPTIIDDSIPTIPINVEAEQISKTEIEITWDESTDDIGISLYEIYKNGDVIDNCTTSSFIDNNINIGETYNYQICAVDSEGNKSGLSTIVSITTELSIPSNIIISGEGKIVNLFWDDDINADSYEIEINSSTIVETSISEYEYNSPIEGELCSFRVRAKTGDVIGDWSSSYNIQLLETLTNIVGTQEIGGI